MGSTTTQALIAARAALAATSGLGLTEAEEILAAGRVVGDSAQLRSLLSEASTSQETKLAAMKAVFGNSVSAPALKLLSVAAGHRWSADDDLLAAMEELGFRIAADSAAKKTDIEGELFAFGKAVASDPELELALSSKLGSADSKVQLVDRLIAGKVSPQSLAILHHLMKQPRGRRMNSLIREAVAIVADQAGFEIATVTTAKPLAAEQLTRLSSGLSASYGRPLKINQIIDPELIGGVRVQVGDEIIDGSVATKLHELRLQLAG